MGEFEGVIQIMDSITALSLLVYAWTSERRERVDLQDRYHAHLENEVRTLSNGVKEQNV